MSLSSDCLHTGYFIYLNWLPSYFNRVLGVNLRSSALLAFLPWLVMAIGCSVAGVIADKQVAAGERCCSSTPLPSSCSICTSVKQSSIEQSW